jgi:hypothetical protein
MAIGTFAASAIFAAIFLFGWRLHKAHPPRGLLSLGAGATAAYVFVHMLPELNEAGDVFVAETAGLELPAPELRVYVAALLGFVVFYGLENLVRWSHQGAACEEVRPRGRGEAGDGPSAVFILHVGGFAVYAWLVSYLMVRGITEKPLPITLYALAMGLHFYGVDSSLLREHGAAYLRVGRYLLAAAALGGWSVATGTDVPRTWLITSLGLVSGGVVMNSMVMELPREKGGRFWPFVLGALLYTLLLGLIR